MELSVIVPTYNERDNIEPLVQKLGRTLIGIDWEVIFVDDDSPDGTAECVRNLARENNHVRVVQRIGRRGLASACVEGMLSSAALYLEIIDGDLQHDETKLPKMLDHLKQDDVDIVVGSRYAGGGGTGDWDRSRHNKSRFATRLSRVIVPSELTDPLSGFFMIKREPFENTVRKLSSLGFKILLDIFASAGSPLRFRGVPYEFRSRQNGASKLDITVMWEFVMLLLDKLVGRWVPVRFISFTLIGGSGLFIHLLIFSALFHGLGRSFIFS